jgi:hypothetical protein
MEDTWTNRDLPVLRAAVQIYEDTGRAKIRVSDVAMKAGLDKDTTQRAPGALHRALLRRRVGHVERRDAVCR